MSTTTSPPSSSPSHKRRYQRLGENGPTSEPTSPESIEDDSLVDEHPSSIFRQHSWNNQEVTLEHASTANSSIHVLSNDETAEIRSLKSMSWDDDDDEVIRRYAQPSATPPPPPRDLWEYWTHSLQSLRQAARQRHAARLLTVPSAHEYWQWQITSCLATYCDATDAGIALAAGVCFLWIVGGLLFTVPWWWWYVGLALFVIRVSARRVYERRKRSRSTTVPHMELATQSRHGGEGVGMV